MGYLHVDGAIMLNYILNRRKVLKCGAGEESRGSAEPIVREMEYYTESKREGTSYRG
jgi:hypothetical protein